MAAKNEVEYYDPQFHGTDMYYFNPMFPDLKYTSSVKFFMEEYQAHWVLDVIGSYLPKFIDNEFVVFRFLVADHKCIFTAVDSRRQGEEEVKTVIITQNIEYTDLSVSIKLFYMNRVLMFPSDY